jgi:hypothetical protein
MLTQKAVETTRRALAQRLERFPDTVGDARPHIVPLHGAAC